MKSNLKIIKEILIFSSGLLFVLSYFGFLFTSLIITDPLTQTPVFELSLGRTKSAIVFSLILTFYFLFGLKYPLALKNHSRRILSGVFLGIIILVFSNWSSTPYSYSERIRFDSYFFFFLITLVPLSLIVSKFLTKTLLFCYFLLLFVFLAHSELRAVFSDDHASVIYRLHLLNEYFPSVPIYNPKWNAGTDWRDFFATGILNVFIIFFPLIKLLGSLEAYRFIIPSIMFGILPLSLYFSTRSLGSSKQGALLAALLGLTSSTTLYRWALTYGSLGFYCSLALLPIAFTSLIRLIKSSGQSDSITENSIRPSQLLLAGTFTTLCSFWSLQAISLIPALLTVLVLTFSKIRKSKILVAIVLLFVVINLFWGALFIKVSKVGGFLKAEQSTTFSVNIHKGYSKSFLKHGAEEFNFDRPYQLLKESSLRTNPVIIALSFFSILFYPFRKIEKRIYTVSIIWLLSLGLFGPIYKPQLELDRFLLIAWIFVIPPVAIFIEESMKNGLKNDLRNVFNKGFLSAFFVTSTLSFASILQNRGWNNYYFQDSSLKNLAVMIEQHTGNGRALFSGFILHHLGGGHLAPVAQLTTKPLVGSSPVHNLWRYTDVIPQNFRERGPVGFEEYLDLMNVSFVLAHEPKWRNYFRDNPAIYKEISVSDPFIGFTRRNNGNYFLRGEGEIMKQNEEEVVLKSTTKDLVIKFNYFPFLKVEGCEKISSYEEIYPLKFIQLENCSENKPITIKSVNPFMRIFK